MATTVNLKRLSSIVRLIWSGTRVTYVAFPFFLVLAVIWFYSHARPSQSASWADLVVSKPLASLMLASLLFGIIPYWATANRNRIMLLLCAPSMATIAALPIAATLHYPALLNLPASVAQSFLTDSSPIATAIASQFLVALMVMYCLVVFALLGCIWLLYGQIVSFDFLLSSSLNRRRRFTFWTLRRLTMYRPTPSALLAVSLALAPALGIAAILSEPRLFLSSEGFVSLCIAMGMSGPFDSPGNAPSFNCMRPSVVVSYYFALLIIVLALLLVFRMIISLACRLMRPSAERAILSASSGPILLLRSFEVENAKVRPVLMSELLQLWRPRLEERLVRWLSRDLPVIAVGQPGERLPPLGAYRAYFDHADWQSRVSSWIGLSKLITVLAGPTEGLRWELSEIEKLGALDRSIIILPRRNRTTQLSTGELISGSIVAIKNDPPKDWLAVRAIAFNKGSAPVYFIASGRSILDYDLILSVFTTLVSRNTMSALVRSDALLAEQKRVMTEVQTQVEVNTRRIKRQLLLMLGWLLAGFASYHIAVHRLESSPKTVEEYLTRQVVVVDEAIMAISSVGVPQFFVKRQRDRLRTAILQLIGRGYEVAPEASMAPDDLFNSGHRIFSRAFDSHSNWEFQDAALFFDAAKRAFAESGDIEAELKALIFALAARSWVDNPQDVIDKLSELVRRNNAPPVAYYFRSLAYLNVGDVGLALGDLKTYETVGGVSVPQSHLALGKALWMAGDRESALRSLDRVIESNVTDVHDLAEALLYRGRIFESLHEIKLMLSDYQRGLILPIRPSESNLKLSALAYLKIGQPSLALRAARRLSMRTGGDSEASVIEGSILETLQSNEAALQAYQRALKIDALNEVAIQGVLRLNKLGSKAK